MIYAPISNYLKQLYAGISLNNPPTFSSRRINCLSKQDLCLMLSYLSPAPQALPQAAGFSSGLSAAPHAAGFSSGLSAAPHAAGVSAGLSPAPHAAGLSDAPQALPTVFSFHPAMFDNAMVCTSSMILFSRLLLSSCCHDYLTTEKGL